MMNLLKVGYMVWVWNWLCEWVELFGVFGV